MNKTHNISTQPQPPLIKKTSTKQPTFGPTCCSITKKINSLTTHAILLEFCCGWSTNGCETRTSRVSKQASRACRDAICPSISSIETFIQSSASSRSLQQALKSTSLVAIPGLSDGCLELHIYLVLLNEGAYTALRASHWRLQRSGVFHKTRVVKPRQGRLYLVDSHWGLCQRTAVVALRVFCRNAASKPAHSIVPNRMALSGGV